MAEMADTQKKDETIVAQGANPVAQDAAPVSSPPQRPEQESNFEHTKIKGRFNQYQSGYWSLAVPLLSARYTADAVNEIIKVGRKTSEGATFDLRNILKRTPKSKEKSLMKDGVWAVVVGVIMNVVTAFYTASTYGDMKRQFKEPVGWEFDKDPDKVNIVDMFKSKNILVHDAVKNFAHRTGMRFLADLPFFAWTVPSPFRDKAGKYLEIDGTEYTKLLGPKGSVNLGVGVNAMYLASDSFLRKRTFFEELQSFIDTKINHNERQGDLVTSQDLINLYDRQAATNHSAMPLPKMNTPEWQNDLKLFERMADLMNQTYGNVPKKERADFTVPKLIYLLGTGLEKSSDLQKDLAYVELANSYGIPAVKQVAQAVKNGVALDTALQPYPEVHDKLPALAAAAIVSETAPEQSAKSFANENLKKLRPEIPTGTHVEKAAQVNEAGAGMTLGA